MESLESYLHTEPQPYIYGISRMYDTFPNNCRIHPSFVVHRNRKVYFADSAQPETEISRARDRFPQLDKKDQQLTANPFSSRSKPPKVHDNSTRRFLD